MPDRPGVDTMYRFERYRLDPQRRELSRDGVSVPLRPKVFALLALLLEQRDRVVDRETLFARLWPGRIVSDATLSSCVKELRKALDDTGRERRCIRTVHGQGFRFVAPVTAVDPVGDHGQTASGQPAPGPGVSAATAVKDVPPPSAEPDTPDFAVVRSERKTVSALRCALLRADESAERLGAETTHRLMQELLAGVREIVERYDGEVTQWLSDGCLALFGVPISHDDDARRAVHAAADVLDRCRALAQAHGVAFACGVTSGIAVVGGVPGGTERHYSASGALLRTAERLCFAAGDGEIAIDAGTYRLVRGGVRVRRLETDGAVRAWLVRRLLEAHAGVPRRFRQPLAPLVGREREMALLAERLADVRRGWGRAVALVGAAGIGKTRLLEEFRASLDAESVVIGVGCLPEHRHTPDHLLGECLRGLCGVRAGDDEALVAERVGQAARAAGVDDAAARELLLAFTGHAAADAAAASLSPQARRELAENALSRLLFGGDDVRVLIVEDLHWIDPGSAAWLGSVVQRMGNQRLLLLASYRTGTSPDWLRYPDVTQLPLAPLSAADATRLLEALPRRGRDAAALTRLVDGAGGNPFLLCELALRGDDGQPIPDTVQAVLSARIDELAATDKHMLQSAAVLGSRARTALLVAVCGTPVEEASEVLRRLQVGELLFIELDADGERVAFRHELVREAAYAMLLSDERERLHARVVQTIDTAFASGHEARPESLALHCERAGLADRAARLWQRAAAEASARCAYVETVRYAERGLGLLPGATPVAVAQAELELALMHSLGHAQMAIHGYALPEVERTWARAEALCEVLGDEVSRFRVLLGLGYYHLASGRPARVPSINRRLARIARMQGSVPMRIRARAAMGELTLHHGRTRSAVRHFERCLAFVEDIERPSFLGQSAVVLAETHLAWARHSLGEEIAALVHGERALAAAHASDKPILLAMALGMNAKLNRFRGDAARAATLARETIDIAACQRFVYWHGSALVTLGWAEAQRGDPAGGIEAIESGIEKVRRTGERLMLPLRLGALADAQRLHGQHELARSTLTRALGLARQTGERHCLPELLRVERELGGESDRGDAQEGDAREGGAKTGGAKTGERRGGQGAGAQRGAGS